jgi:hypothetical protein
VPTLKAVMKLIVQLSDRLIAPLQGKELIETASKEWIVAGAGDYRM